MKEFWNQRYNEEGFAYGDQPNRFLQETLHTHPAHGKAFFAAEGEGRNAVYAATLGLDVYACDYSDAGKAKALQLAKDKGVSISYQIGDLTEVEPENGPFDLIVLIYAHFPPSIRKEIHQRLIKHLKPGGLLILEGFSKANLERRKLNPKVGGPDKLDLLFSTDEIAEDMSSLQTELLEETVTELNEGKYHVGTASVIRFIGRKP